MTTAPATGLVSAVIVAFFAAVPGCVIAAIWTHDGRWIACAIVCGISALILAAMAE